MLDPKQCVLFSGGAAGTEQFFGAQAEAWGIEEVNYSFDGHQIDGSAACASSLPKNWP